MGVPVDSGNERWGWEGEPPTLTEKQSALLEATIDEVRASPLSSSVKVDGARSAVWRYLVAAQWRLEQAGGKRVSDFFVDTLKWRQEEGVDGILAQAQTFGSEASSGKLFVHGTCVMKRPLIWFHLGRENNALDPEANVRFLIYTVVSDRCGQDVVDVFLDPLSFEASIAKVVLMIVTRRFRSSAGRYVVLWRV